MLYYTSTNFKYLKEIEQKNFLDQDTTQIFFQLIHNTFSSCYNISWQLCHETSKAKFIHNSENVFRQACFHEEEHFQTWSDCRGKMFRSTS